MRPPTSKRTWASLSGQSTHPKRLYKWTDDQGRIHITDTPPPDSPGKEGTTGSE
ncbi:MAG: DUF4124 domain-containing protein [Proteobacteria bacterium]|nr:DUF4124 domain-containing protein [Pseudomonadota bacterium]